MLKTVLFAAAATVASLAASPSIAAPVTIAPVALEGAAAPEAAPVKATQRTRETRYCVIATVTGSIIPHKECRTRSDWIHLTGIDPLEKN